METILTSLKAGLPRDSITELGLPYFGTLNKLVNFESKPSEGHDNFGDKLLTRLPSNPSQFEKDLRTLVLDLYSDHGPGDKGHRDLIGMDSTDGTLLKPAGKPLHEDVFKYKQDLSSLSSGAPSLEAGLKERPILLKYQETALISKAIQRGEAGFQEQVPPVHKNQMTYSPGCDSHQSSLKSFEELHRNPQNFDLTDATELLRDRHGSTESRSFSDSGIHLELLPSDNEINDNDYKGYRDGNDSSGLDDSLDDKEMVKTRHCDDSADAVGRANGDEGAVTLQDKPETLIQQLEQYTTESVGDQDQGYFLPKLPLSGTSVLSSTPRKMVREPLPQSEDTQMTTDAHHETIDKAKEEISSEETCQLRLELANMEGRLESLTTEYRGILEEKKGLQARMKAMEVMANKDESKKSLSFCEERFELQKLHEKESQLENKILELQQDVDAKDKYINDAEEKLKVSQKNIEKLQETLQSLETELISKSDDAELLQNQLGELNKTLTEVQVLHEGQLKENEVLQSDASTLLKAKSWLLKQLDVSKDAHVKLELELSEYKSTVFSQSKQVEELKVENARTSQQLTETQEKAFIEKAKILQHLEKVEEDLLNQDAAFRKMQTEKETVQRELTVKIESLQKENVLLQSLASSAKKLQDELEILKNEANMKTNLLKKLEEEKVEVDQQLKVARNINEVSDKRIKALSLKMENNEIQLQKASSELEAKEANVRELEKKNSMLEVSIKEAQEEKEALDGAVQLLRVELDKVERRFKMMKRELTSKTNQLEELTRQKDGFVNELRVLRDELEKHTKLLQTLRDTIRERDETITALHNDKVKLLADVRGLRERLQNTQANFEETLQEKDKLHEQLQNYNSQILHLEKRLYESCSEKAKLEGELESAARTARDQEIAYKTQNESLKQELNETQKNFQNEVTRHRDEAINLGQEVEYFKGQLQEKSKKYKNEVLELKEKLVQEEASKKMIETNARKKFKEQCDSTVKEIEEKYEKKLNEKEQGLMSMSQEKEELFFKYTELEERARNTANLQKERILTLKKELGFARKVLSEQRVELEKFSMMSIELEREKGRLAGLMTSQKTLRAHCVKMEQSAANKELKISELNSSLETSQKEQVLQRKEAERKIVHLESTLAENKETIEELKMRLNSERTENFQLRTRLNESEEEIEKVLKQLTSARTAVENTNEKYEKCLHDLKSSDESLRAVKFDLQDSKLLAYKLENEYKILKEQEKVKDDIANSMEWKLNQCRKELDCAKEKLRLSDERHQIELENLKTACQVAKSEASYLRREVTMARKSKRENQEKFFTSRDEVLTTKQEKESLKQELFLASQQLRYLKSAILNAQDITEIQEFVKKEEEVSFVPMVTTDPANQDVAYFNSTLIGLRDCMSLLRNQISSLQDQMNKHTDAVCSTASFWRSFEKNVQILHNDCVVPQEQLAFTEKDNIRQGNMI